METLIKCSKVLYDHDIADKTKEIVELKGKLESYEPPKKICHNESGW